MLYSLFLSWYLSCICSTVSYCFYHHHIEIRYSSVELANREKVQLWIKKEWSWCVILHGFGSVCFEFPVVFTVWTSLVGDRKVSALSIHCANYSKGSIPDFVKEENIDKLVYPGVLSKSCSGCVLLSWFRAHVYGPRLSYVFSLSIPPVGLCFGLIRLLGCGLIFATGVLYGLMALGKK